MVYFIVSILICHEIFSWKKLKKDEPISGTREQDKNAMKKILIATSVWGFLAKFGKEDVRILQELGYEVHYASNKNNPIYQFPTTVYEDMNVIFHDIDIWQSPFGFKQNAKAVKQIREIVKKENITLLHCHTPSGGMVTRLASIGLPVKVIYTAHGFHFYKGAGKLHNFIYYSIESFLSFFTDVIVTVNREDYKAARKMHQRIGTWQIPGVGLDREYFYETTLEQRTAAKKSLGVNNHFFVLGVGELRENKNPEVIIRALALLKEKKGRVFDFIYGLVGAGKQEPELRQLAEDLGVGENIIFYGYQTDVRPYLKAADVLAFPTIREGLGMSALEAMSMGVAVLAADNRGTREFMADGENGYVCKKNEPSEYAGLLEKMYEERNQWGLDKKRRGAVRKSTEPFDKRNTAEIMREIYGEAIN